MTMPNYTKALAVSIMALVAGLLALVALTPREAEAAFPGQNGKIDFESDWDGDDEIYSRTSTGVFIQKKLTSNSVEDSAPAVSPDGKKIVFVSDRDGNEEIYVMNSNGSGQTNLTNSILSNEFYPDFSPDGEKIAYQRGWEDAPEIYVMASDGEGKTNLTNKPIFGCS